MKKYLVLGAIAALTVSSVSADDSMKSTTKTTTTRTVKKAVVTEGPVDRTLEVRIGPRASFLNGEARFGGPAADTVDVWDDLNLDEPNPGIAFDVDWQPFNRWHLALGATYDNYDQSGTTSRNIRTASGEVLQSGGTVNVDGHVIFLEGKIGYDLIKTNTYRLQPYIGGKGAWIDADVTGTGTVTATGGAGATLTRTGTRVTSLDDGYGTFIGGIDQRLYISRSWYVGADVAGFGMDQWGYVTGDAYTGYDFSKTWGVRAGWDANWMTYENSNASTQIDALLHAVYVQAVWGF
jgi:hypothetical protein